LHSKNSHPSRKTKPTPRAGTRSGMSSALTAAPQRALCTARAVQTVSLRQCAPVAAAFRAARRLPAGRCHRCVGEAQVPSLFLPTTSGSCAPPEPRA
jgi:hypothetical protein